MSIQMDSRPFDTSTIPPNIFPGHSLSTGATKQLKTKKFILSKFTLYETKERMYIVGSNKRETMFRILEIDLTVPQEELNVLEDNIFFTRSEIMDVLSRLEEASGVGLQKKITVCGLLGFIRFTSCNYLVVVTKCSQVAVIGGHSVFHIDGTELVPISNSYKKPDKYSMEAKLMSTFQNLDLSKTFYYSYTYDISNTLQTNLLREKLKAVNRTDITIPSGMQDFNEMYIWNMNLLNPLFNCIDTVYDWFQIIIHGFIDQINISILGKPIYITMIARRSHYFAGARFLKRGVNTQGCAANEVETEQIVADMVLTPFHMSGSGYFDSDRYTSFVQHRGSIPLYWSQAASNLTAKPPIELNVVDPYFVPAGLHFDKLFQRYGGGVIQVLNLIKTKERVPRETKLLAEYEQCIAYLNQFLPETKKIEYTSWDMSRASKQDGQLVIEFLEKYAMHTVAVTGIFKNGPTFETTQVQEGICRTNCIDCLDRTNAAQFVIGKRALGVQLKELGITDEEFLEYDSDIVNILTELFHDLGDTIALQYGGSHLVNTMETYRKINQWRSHSRDTIESIKRFYSNSFIDAQRQDATNLFLGHYVWKTGLPPLWEMTSDFYLHNEYISQSPKRSYTHWWNDYHIKSIREILQEQIIDQNNDITTEKIIANISGYPGAFDNYWNEYYSPKSLTWIHDLFAFNMNSTRRYRSTKKKDKEDTLSPFRSRKPSSTNKKLRHLLTVPESRLVPGEEGPERVVPERSTNTVEGKYGYQSALSLAYTQLERVLNGVSHVRDELDSLLDQKTTDSKRLTELKEPVMSVADTGLINADITMTGNELREAVQSTKTESGNELSDQISSRFCTRLSAEVEDYERLRSELETLRIKDDYDSYVTLANVKIHQSDLDIYCTSINFPASDLIVS